MKLILVHDRWHNYFMMIARATARLSYCNKLKVGAVAVRERRPVATGYNGTLPGMDNCCEDKQDNAGNMVLVTSPEVEHAERNLISFAAREGIKLLDTTVYITHSPCVECSKAIVNAGVKTLVFGEAYKCRNGIELLEVNGVEVIWYTGD